MGKKKDKQELDFYQEIYNADNRAICIIDTHSMIHSYNNIFSQIAKIQQSSLHHLNIFDTIDLKLWDNTKNTQNPFDELSAAVENRTSYVNKNIKIESLKNHPSLPAKLTLSPFILNNEQYYELIIEDETQEFKEKQSQTDFVSLMSHELRTPIATINGYLELALNPEFAVMDGNAKKYISSAHESTNHLSELLKSLLSVTRIDSNEEKMTLSIRDINEQLRSFSKEYLILAKNKNIDFKINIKNEEAFAKINQVIFREIITNIINNAIKYTKNGGYVELSSIKAGNKINISIKDTGEGIKTEDLENIFKKFYRATSSKEQGSGLGLYLVKRQTEKMGGKISVQSKIGNGSIFTISLPLVNMSSKEMTKTFIEEFTPISIDEINKYDPFSEDMSKYVRYPRLSNSPIAKSYVELSKKWSRGEVPSTTEEEKNKVYEGYKKIATGPSMTKFDKIWVQIKPRLDNIGLAKVGRFFISKYVLPWILEAPNSKSWELAFGYCYDYEWNWRKIEKDDQMYWLVIRDPQLNWIRQRTILSRKEISNKNKVLFLNAGCLPELRHIDNMGLPKEIWACNDERDLNSEDIFGWSAKEHNVIYEKADTLEYLDKMAIENQKFDVIVMDGGSFQNYKEIDKIITSATSLLNENGEFIFDIQPLQWDHELMNYVLGIYYADETTAPKDIPTAIKAITKICDTIGGIRLKYAIDKRNDTPSGIMFYIERN